MDARRAIAKIHRDENAWVRVDRVHRLSDGLCLELAVCRGRRGPITAIWRLECRGVREANIRDLDGGGLQVWSGTHPAARQYTDDLMTISLSKDRIAEAVGVLLEAHAATVDDWIPFERYLGLTVPAPAKLAGLRLKAPRFLMKRYAAALRELGLPCRPSRSRRRQATKPLRVVHFGSSYVVAERLDMRNDERCRTRG